MPDPIAAVGATGQVPGAGNTTDNTLQALSGIGSDGFMRLLVAQLQYQNPLEPSDPSDMMLQTAQLAQLDATNQMVELQQRNFGLQQAVMAAGMVGSEVVATDTDGLAVTGVVDAVRYTVVGPVLEVDGREVALGEVTELRHVDASQPTTDEVVDLPLVDGTDGTTPIDQPAADTVTETPDAATVEPEPDGATTDSEVTDPALTDPDAEAADPAAVSDASTTVPDPSTVPTDPLAAPTDELVLT